MFKNAILYKIDLGNMVYVEACIHLSDHQFASCGPTQEKSSGWVPPREANGAMIELVGGQWILKMMTEVKAVPAEVINRKTAERCAQIEASTGRKSGKKETRDLKDDIRMELLPMAFSKQSATLVWIDPQACTMLVDASSQSKADDVVTAFVASVPGVTVRLINTKVTPASCMAGWLLEQEHPTNFSIDRECELMAIDESKSAVKYGNHRLDIEEVHGHIIGGKMPTRLAMTWSDRVSFVLTEGWQLKKLAFLDVVFDGHSFEDVKDSSPGDFDADVAIATGELCKMIPDLLDVLGGEVSDKPSANPSSIVTPAIHIGADIDGPDPMYDQAVDVVRKQKKPSISLVQRHLKIGYNRAARLIEDMERAGLVSPMKSNGIRELLNMEKV